MKQKGQTLVETLVAIFVLVTGLISAISLAIYSFQASDNANKQVVATALAREAVETIQNIRDTNWLTGTIQDCSATMGAGQQCYTNWLQSINSPGDYTLQFNPSSNNWALNSVSSPNNTTFVLNYDSSNGVYNSSNGSGTASVFSRKVNLSFDTTTAPFSATNPMLKVVATVWWYGRKCPQAIDPNTLPPSCKVSLELHLTNWRNY